MAEPRKPSAPPPVSCDVCLKEIPKSEAQSAEARDYVLYFCGLECYQQWQRQQQEEDQATEPPTRGEDEQSTP